MMMKKLLNIVLVLVASLSLSGCDDFLTKTPTDQLSSLGYWSTEKDVEYWMNGTYNGLVTLSGFLRSYGECRSDSVYPNSYPPGPEYQLSGLTSSTRDVDWTPFYTVIARCNLAIANIPNMGSVSEVSKQKFLAEFHGIRGLMYFYLVRLWGDCPLMLEPWDFQYETRYNKRSSVELVTAAIESDIKTSVANFEAAGSRVASSAAYFNQAAAYALQMDFLTWQRKWADVITVYDKFKAAFPNKGLVAGVPGEENFMTNVALWKQVFLPDTAGSDTREAIFSLVYSEANSSDVNSPYSDDTGFSGSNYAFVLGRSTYMMMVQDIWDVRLGGSIEYTTNSPINLVPENAPVYQDPGGRGNIQRVDKFHANTGFMRFQRGATWRFPCPVYRYADVILLYAEALNRVSEGNAQSVVDIINQIRASRGSSIVFDAADYTSQLGIGADSREKLIMDERLLEFYGEPKRWFDLLRLDWGYDVLDEHVRYLQGEMGIPVVGFGDKARMLFPISQSLITRNDELEQNDGY